MPELRVRNHRGVHLLTLGVGGGGLALAAFLEPLRSRFLVFACAAAGLVGAIGVLDRRVKLTLSEEGIVYARWGGARIPWEEFAGYRSVRWRRQPYLQLVARRPTEILERFSRVGRLNHRCAALVGMPLFAVAVTPLGIAASDLARWVGRHLPEAPERPE